MGSKKQSIRDRLKEKLEPQDKKLIVVPKPKKLMYKKGDDIHSIALMHEINDYNKISQDSLLFIVHNNLKPFSVGYNPGISDLPLETYLGVIYLIKGNTIIEFNTCHCYDTVPIYHADWQKIFIPDKGYFIRTEVIVHNIELADIKEFNSPQTFIDIDGMISYSSVKTENFIVALARSGFDIYVKN
jgi:hypothetical protein